MSKPVAIIGAGRTAAVVAHEFKKLGRPVFGNFIEPQYLGETSAFEQTGPQNLSLMFQSVDPAEVDIFVAIGYQNMNSERARLTKEIRLRGYSLTKCISRDASVSDPGLVEDGCYVGPFSDIQVGARIQEGSFVWSSTVIGHGALIGSYSWVTSGVTVGGDAIVGARCFLGLNSSVSHNVVIGEANLVAAGTHASKSTPEDTLTMNPAAAQVIGVASRSLDAFGL